ncbi:MAG: AAA-like domain-containing protein [Candidatus Sumerlaeota bacterium]|nr:AAA-like domain-containing protein [Candidatus Sumerlaeota bacterium]
MKKKRFNTTGPCFANEHYMLPAQARCADLLPLIEQQSYFCIHAPRQSGKTTLIKDFARTLNQAGQYHGLFCDLQVAEPYEEEARAMQAVMNALSHAVRYHPALKPFEFDVSVTDQNCSSILGAKLTDICARLDKPLVVMFDEADCLCGPALLSFLRQLRSGYIGRDTAPFVHSLALVGMRNLRDYKLKIRDESETLGRSSPFNIVTEALTLRRFTRDEIAQLYAQHTEATGQAFPADVMDEVFRSTNGQPWLVNAIAREVVEKLLSNDTSQAIKLEHVEQAIQNIILRRETHIQSLLQRLSEPRVRRIIEPVITGENDRFSLLDDDYQYVSDMGLVITEGGVTRPANPIYAEVILRMLNFDLQHRLDSEDYSIPPLRYIENGRLNMRKLLGEFQGFWRQHSEIWREMPLYKEAAPHLIVTAFLQRIINAKGRLDREYAAGLGRMDLCVHFGGERFPIEIKVPRTESDIARGLDQLKGYMDRLGVREGWLMIFDSRPGIPWDQKIYWRDVERASSVLHCVGC